MSIQPSLPEKGSLLLLSCLPPFVFAWLCLVLLSGCRSGAQITEGSKTQACRAQVVDALGAFQRDKGLAFSADPADVDLFFDSGHISKSYVRDGVEHTSHFRAEKSGDGCRLVFFKRQEAQPGHTETVSGGFGSVLLSGCDCH